MVTRTDSEVRQIIQNFMNGKGSKWDWDDFTSLEISDPYLESIRRMAEHLPRRYPPEVLGHYCSHDGLEKLTIIANDLLS